MPNVSDLYRLSEELRQTVPTNSPQIPYTSIEEFYKISSGIFQQYANKELYETVEEAEEYVF